MDPKIQGSEVGQLICYRTLQYSPLRHLRFELEVLRRTEHQPLAGYYHCLLRLGVVKQDVVANY